MEKRVKDRVFNLALELGMADCKEAGRFIGARERAAYFALRHSGLIKKVPLLKTLAFKVFKAL